MRKVTKLPKYLTEAGFLSITIDSDQTCVIDFELQSGVRPTQHHRNLAKTWISKKISYGRAPHKRNRDPETINMSGLWRPDDLPVGEPTEPVNFRSTTELMSWFRDRAKATGGTVSSLIRLAMWEFRKTNGGKIYVYTRTEPDVWTVGFYAPTGEWISESDHSSPEKAADRVAYLNGSKNA